LYDDPYPTNHPALYPATYSPPGGVVNVFALSRDPREAARWAIDRHVVKMTLETAQILATVSWQHGCPAPYRPTHAKHPCVLWAAETSDNFRWLVEHGLALAAEYERRYGKTHKSAAVIAEIASSGVRPAKLGLTDFAQAMPEHYRGPDSVAAYRAYYRGDKAPFATWKAPAEPPPWWTP
jgi:hypothetical protein